MRASREGGALRKVEYHIPSTSACVLYQSRGTGAGEACGDAGGFESAEVEAGWVGGRCKSSEADAPAVEDPLSLSS